MSYTVEKLEKSQVKMVFDIDAQTFAKAIDAAYDKTKHKYAIAGFRKGHVPKKVIEGIYGKEVFYEDAMDIIIPEAYGEALDKETELEVVAQPELNDFNFKEDGGAAFVLTVTVKPEVKLGAYKGLGITKKVDKVTPKDVDETIDKERNKQARLIDVETEAFSGNTVTIDFEGSVDGVKFDGGSAQDYDLELGSNTFIPGFEEQLIGAKIGDKKDVKVVFPEDYQAEELNGKEAIFACTVKAIKVKQLPELDDDFVKEISEFDTLAEYKADVKEKLTKEAEDKAERAFEDELVEKVVANAQIEVPQAMIDDESADMVNEFEYRLQCQGLKLEDYLQYLNLTREKLQEEYKTQAEATVKTRLVMEAIVKAEDLKFEDKDVDEKLAKMAESAGAAVEDYKKSLGKEQINYVVNAILSEKLMLLLKTENGKATKADKKADTTDDEKKAAKKPAAKKDDTAAEKKPAAKKTTKSAEAKTENAE